MTVYTDHDYREAGEYYATLSLPELRRYQAITQAQIPLAYAKRLVLALEHLQHVDRLITEAIHHKAFGSK